MDGLLQRNPGRKRAQGGSRNEGDARRVLQATLERARVDSSRVKGVGFTGTCSLVVLGVDGRPVSASGSGDDARNVVLWMDHRAVGEAAEINATGHDVLKYVGGIISPEMQAPKLLWLKRVGGGTWGGLK